MSFLLPGSGSSSSGGGGGSGGSGSGAGGASTPPGAPGGLTPPANVSNPDTEADSVLASCGAFAGQIIEISSIANAVKVTTGGAEVRPPYWTPAMIPAHAALPPGQSDHPAAVPTKAGSDVEMTVKIEVTRADGLSGSSTITGRLGSDTWQGTCPSAVGTHDVTVRLPASTTRLASHRGDIVWEADVPGCGRHPLGRTRVEIFRIVEAVSPVYLNRGRPVEGLRFVYDGAGIERADAAASNAWAEVTGRITRHLHSGHGMTYDIHRGGVGFLSGGSGGFGFDMTNYIAKTGTNTSATPPVPHMLNCYDQASAVQVFTGIAGIEGHKRYVEPFGFITTTTLVGGIRTNNPFHGGNGSPPVVPKLSPNRTPFGNHEFYMNTAEAKTFDACAGPHMGTETYDAYLAASVDTDMQWVSGVRDGADLQYWRSRWQYGDDYFKIIDIS